MKNRVRLRPAAEKRRPDPEEMRPLFEFPVPSEGFLHHGNCHAAHGILRIFQDVPWQPAVHSDLCQSRKETLQGILTGFLHCALLRQAFRPHKHHVRKSEDRTSPHQKEPEHEQMPYVSSSLQVTFIPGSGIFIVQPALTSVKHSSSFDCVYSASGHVFPNHVS